VATEAQIEANRRNAARSTGPKSAAGKRIVAKNAVRHGLLSNEGLLFGESADEFAVFSKRLERELAPKGEIEGIKVGNIVRLAWKLRRRLPRMEAALQMWKCYERCEDPATADIKLHVIEAATNMEAAFVGVSPEDLSDAAQQRAEDQANLELVHNLSAAAWAASVELIERYEDKIARRLRKEIKELEARQARRASREREHPTGALQDAA
jgi:hypothetical protein